MNAVIYARYSSHGQTEQSIDGQLRDNHAWAKQQGITVIGEYIDRALTGTRDQRPDFQRMINDAARRQFEMVIVWKLDRFARNRYDSAIYKAKLKKYGVRVVSVKENITDSPEGIILEGLLESMAEYYSANLSQNIRRGQRESVAKGTWLGGRVPLGYKAKDKKLVIDDRTAPIVRYVFEQYASGAPKKQIVEELDRRGMRNRNGNPLTVNAFHRMLSNTVYIGSFTYNGEAVPGLAEPMIDKETFEKVQQHLKTVARAPAAGKAKERYLLQGKVFCGHCGAPMIGESGRSHTGRTYSYYTCANRKKGRKCDKKNERRDDVERYVVEQTINYVLAPSCASSVAKAVVEEYKKEFSGGRIESLEKLLRQLDHEIEKLIDALLDAPKSTHQKIYARMESIEAQKADLETDLAKLRVASRICLTESEVTAWLSQFRGGDPSDEAFRRRVIDVFINAVYLYDDRIILFYNIRGGEHVTYSDLPPRDTAEDDPHQSRDHSATSTTTNYRAALARKGSDLKSNAPPKRVKSEPLFTFVSGVFGLLFYR